MSDGFARWKPGQFATLPDRRLLAEAFGLRPGFSAAAAPDPAALADLDRLSGGMVERSGLRERFRDDPAMIAFLGLDQESDVLRLRASVYRAFSTSATYAEQFADFTMAAKAAAIAIPQAMTELERLVEGMQPIVAFEERWLPDSGTGIGDAISKIESTVEAVAAALRLSTQAADDAIERTGSIVDELIAAADEALENAAHEDDERPADAPDRLLLLRLAEIYSASFGKPAPLHYTHTVEGGPDKEFGRFLDLALRSLGWPARPDKSAHGKRELGDDRTGDAGQPPAMFSDEALRSLRTIDLVDWNLLALSGLDRLPRSAAVHYANIEREMGYPAESLRYKAPRSGAMRMSHGTLPSTMVMERIGVEVVTTHLIEEPLWARSVSVGRRAT